MSTIKAALIGRIAGLGRIVAGAKDDHTLGSVRKRLQMVTPLVQQVQAETVLEAKRASRQSGNTSITTIR